MLAKILNDRRKHDMYSYPWLNSLCAKLIAKEDGTEIRPAYIWGVMQGAALARAISIKHISVIEFGVAGGRGLIALEKIAENIESIFEVAIDVYGFDTGMGLPKPQDYRDLPNLYAKGDYFMDKQQLKERLKQAKLIIGPVKETVVSFIESKPSPVAFISFDLDLYTSTMDAFNLLNADQTLLLPRIHCYMDDIMGYTFGDHNGERLAIFEFNSSQTMRKISQIYGLKYYLPWPLRNSIWTEMFYMAHIFDHDLYRHNDSLIRTTVADIGD